MATNFRLAPGEYHVSCPYNPSHTVTNTTIIKHLHKCKMNYIKEKGDKADIISCKWNWSHKYPKIAMDYHERTCPDRHTIIPHLEHHQSQQFQASAAAHLIATSNGFAGRGAQPNANASPEGDDDWESESNGYTPAYDPMVRIQQGPFVPLTPQGLQPAERRRFREEARIRGLKELEEQEKMKNNHPKQQGGPGKNRKR